MPDVINIETIRKAKAMALKASPQVPCDTVLILVPRSRVEAWRQILSPEDFEMLMSGVHPSCLS